MIWAFLFAAKLVLSHPFHVSVCDMRYEKDDKHLKISVRLFLDDLEDAIQLQNEDPSFDIMDPADSANIHSSIERYLQENLLIFTEEKLVPTYLGGEVDIDVMWCYLEVKPLEPFDELSVESTIMTDLFTDQENIIHVRTANEVRSLRLNNDNVFGTVEFN
jgi:hypothetical protein